MKRNEAAIASPILPVPEPARSPLPFLEYVRTIGDNFIAGYDEELYEEWIVRRRLPGADHFIVSDPAAIKRVLIDNAAKYVKGEMELRIAGLGLSGTEAVKLDRIWRTRRRLVSATLDYRSLPAYAPAISDCTVQLMTAWSGLGGGAVVELERAMRELTSKAMAQVLFSSDSSEVAEALDGLTGEETEGTIDLVDFVPALNRLRRSYRGRMANRRFRRTTASIDRVIERRRQEGGGERDLLDRLISVRDQETERPMEVEELRTVVTTLFAAGHLSAGQTLAWSFYLLSQHPEQERRLHDELDRVLAGRRPTFADLDRLPYARIVIEETLRLYPPFHMLAWREATEQDELCGVVIPKGATVSIAPWLLHRHRRLWENPECFDPERFLPERSAGRPQMAFLPFGAGPRVCMGATFAMMEMVLILATIAQRFRLRLVAEHKVEPRARLMLSARFGLPMTLEPR